jgi:hypothetical protein
MTTFKIPEGDGPPALEEALRLRMYNLVNSQHLVVG